KAREASTGSAWIRQAGLSGSLGGSAAGALGRDGSPRDLDDRRERRGVVDGQVGQDLAVDLDLGEPEALDQAVVGQAVGPGPRVDPGDPQLAEVALAVTPVTVRVLHRVQHLLLGLAVQPRALPAVAARGLEQGAALLLGVDRTLDACHFGTPNRVTCVARAS